MVVLLAKDGLRLLLFVVATLIWIFLNRLLLFAVKAGLARIHLLLLLDGFINLHLLHCVMVDLRVSTLLSLMGMVGGGAGGSCANSVFICSCTIVVVLSM